MSRYAVYIRPAALREIKDLPANMRHRIQHAVSGLATDPQPSGSKQLLLPDVELSVYRIRIDQWRIVYAMLEASRSIAVLTVRKRPPYDYDDLAKLLTDR